MSVDAGPGAAWPKRVVILHPFLFTVSPILFLFSQNFEGVRITEVLLLTGKALLVSAVVWAGLRFILKNGRKSALILSLFVVLFTSHGHLSDLLRQKGFSLPWLGRGAVVLLIPASAVALIAGSYLTVKTRKPLADITKILNVCAACLVALSVIRITAYEIGAFRTAKEATRTLARKTRTILSLGQPDVRRNVYYIILDAYTRSDVLRDLYDYDNSEVISFLKSKGFYVAANSRSNYPATDLSLASSLNFAYLENANGAYDMRRWVPLKEMIAHSRVGRLLKEAGYQFVCFDDNDEIQNADLRMQPWKRTTFTEELLKTTAAVPLGNPNVRKRQQIIRYPFEHLPETAEMKPPVFVFAHIMAPHWPFVFAADGSEPDLGDRLDANRKQTVSRTEGIPRSEYLKLYRDQVTYVDKLLIATVEGILAKSKIPPIIVIQGDHGPCAYLHQEDPKGTYIKERMSILNAYYLPDGGDALLYDGITPVNTFRVIFKYYFSAECSLLDDKSFFSAPADPWYLVDVTETIGGEEDTRRLEALRQTEYFPEPAAFLSTDAKVTGTARPDASTIFN